MRALALLFALAGCNTIFGLDPTTLAPDAEGCRRGGDPGFVDEDGDTIDDTCDDCPWIADLDQHDGDGDGVGDACDVTSTPTTQVFFDGFHGASLSNGWIAGPLDQWDVMQDYLWLDNSDGSALLTVDTLSLQHGRVVAPVEITEIPLATTHVVGPVFDTTGAGAGTAGYVCGARQTTAGSADLVLTAWTAAGSMADLAITALGALDVGTIVSFDVRFNAGDQRCAAGGASVPAADTTNTIGTAGLGAQGILFRIPYIVIYEESP